MEKEDHGNDVLSYRRCALNVMTLSTQFVSRIPVKMYPFELDPRTRMI